MLAIACRTLLDPAFSDNDLRDTVGKSYKCKMHLVSPDRLEVRGYIGISFFGRTFDLTR